MKGKMMELKKFIVTSLTAILFMFNGTTVSMDHRKKLTPSGKYNFLDLLESCQLTSDQKQQVIDAYRQYKLVGETRVFNKRDVDFFSKRGIIITPSSIAKRRILPEDEVPGIETACKAYLEGSREDLTPEDIIFFASKGIFSLTPDIIASLSGESFEESTLLGTGRMFTQDYKTKLFDALKSSGSIADEEKRDLISAYNRQLMGGRTFSTNLLTEDEIAMLRENGILAQDEPPAVAADPAAATQVVDGDAISDDGPDVGPQPQK